MLKKVIKTLYITNMFPTNEHPAHGIFIKEQIKDLSTIIPIKPVVFLIESVYKSKVEYFKSIYRIPKIIQSNNFDIIHIHYGISGLFLLFFKPKPKVFLTLHGSDIQRRKTNGWQVWLTKKILPKVDLVFVQNQFMKNIVTPFNPNVEVVTCGVDSDFFHPDYQSNKLSKYKLLLFPSSPKREVKNYPLFIKIIKRIREKAPFSIKFSHMEQLSRSEVRTLLNTADCLILTSKTEGSPQVVKEALCCNLPVVSVPVGDVYELINGIPNCFIASSHEVEEMADLVIRVLQVEKQNTRDLFLKKEKYHHTAVAKSLASHYMQGIESELLTSTSEKVSM